MNPRLYTPALGANVDLRKQAMLGAINDKERYHEFTIEMLERMIGSYLKDANHKEDFRAPLEKFKNAVISTKDKKQYKIKADEINTFLDEYFNIKEPAATNTTSLNL